MGDSTGVLNTYSRCVHSTAVTVRNHKFAMSKVVYWTSVLRTHRESMISALVRVVLRIVGPPKDLYSYQRVHLLSSLLATV